MPDKPPDQPRKAHLPAETLHETFIRVHRKHFGNETTLSLSPGDPSLELFVREMVSQQLLKEAWRYTIIPGVVAANNVANRLDMVAHGALDWEPTFHLDIDWKNGQREEYDVSFTEYGDALKESDLIMSEGEARKVVVFYR